MESYQENVSDDFIGQLLDTTETEQAQEDDNNAEQKEEEVEEQEVSNDNPDIQHDTSEDSFLCEESKLIRFHSDPNLDTDWSNEAVFNCYLCNKECEGFGSSVGHFREDHPELLEGKLTNHCIVCPKVNIIIFVCFSHIFRILRSWI